MTEGSSQGLFIVVAIVIFGIFVSLSYTLFGKEGLTNDLQGLFYSATEQVIYDTKKDSVNNLLDYKDVKPYLISNSMIDIDNKRIVFETGTFNAGIRMPYQTIKANKNYKLKFKSKKTRWNYKHYRGSFMALRRH